MGGQPQTDKGTINVFLCQELSVVNSALVTGYVLFLAQKQMVYKDIPKRTILQNCDLAQLCTQMKLPQRPKTNPMVKVNVLDGSVRFNSTLKLSLCDHTDLEFLGKSEGLLAGPTIQKQIPQRLRRDM